MIRIQLWKSDRLLSEQFAIDGPAAERLIDALLNAAHKGEHGEGRFKLDADHITDARLFVGSFYASPWFEYPPPARARAA